MGSTCPTVQMIYISTHFTLLTFLRLTLAVSLPPIAMTLLAFWAVEVVHVGTQSTLLVKAGIVKAYEDYRTDSC